MSANLSKLIFKRAAVPLLVGDRFVEPSDRLLLAALKALGR